MSELWRRLLFLFRGRRLEAELAEELQFHLEMKARECEESGLPPEEARAAARRQFGNTLHVRESSRDFWGWRWLDDLSTDARIGLRMLARRRTLALTAIGSLALGIGGAVTIYTVIHSILLRPLPFRDPERLVQVWATPPDSAHFMEMPPLSDYVNWRAQNSFFEDMAALLLKEEVNLTGDGPPEWLEGQRGTASFFSMLGVPPLFGRSILAGDEVHGAPRVVLLGYGLWQRRFQGDPNLLGRTMSIDGVTHAIIGVMPRGFGIPDGRAAFWRPFDLSPASVQRASYHVYAFARLRPGATLESARNMMTTIAQQTASEGEGGSLRGGVMALRDVVTGPVRERLLPLGGAVAFLLLIACANVTGLLMAAGAERISEGALKSALGATRGRLVRQYLTESILLSLAGCAAGLVLAWFLVDPLIQLSPSEMPRRGEIRLDFTIVLIAAGLSILSGGLSGILPALAGSKPVLTRWMQSAGRSATGGIARQQLRKGLVAAQIAIALTLCTGAGLMIRSIQRLLAVDVGFDPDQVLTFQVRLAETQYATEVRDGTRPAGWSRISAAAPAKFQAILDTLRTVPGVESASAITWLPMNGFFNEGRLFTIVGRPAPPRNAPQPGAGYNPVDADFFRTMRAPLVRGRLFNAQDDAASPWVIIINETLAATWWPNQDPVGQYISYDGWGDPRPRQIVGIVRDIRHNGLSEPPRPQVYFPFVQLPPENHTNRVRSRLHMSFAVRTRADADRLGPLLQKAVGSVDKDVPVYAVQPMDVFLKGSARETRFLTWLLGALALAAVLLSAVGLYGVTNYTVSRRAQEIGIRIALGARPGDMARMVLRQASRVGIAGLAAGLALALALTRFLKSILYGIQPTDPLTLGAACLLLIAVALAAGYFPARRASRMDPVIALRNE
jgi:putative ABC transport system permease protein